MHLVITLVVSLCQDVSTTTIQSKMNELKTQYPDAKVSVRLDKKCNKTK